MLEQTPENWTNLPEEAISPPSLPAFKKILRSVPLSEEGIKQPSIPSIKKLTTHS